MGAIPRDRAEPTTISQEPGVEVREPILDYQPLHTTASYSVTGPPLVPPRGQVLQLQLDLQAAARAEREPERRR